MKLAAATRTSYCAAYVTGETMAGTRAGALPSDPNHATVSRTRSKVSVYAPAAEGAVTPVVAQVDRGRAGRAPCRRARVRDRDGDHVGLGRDERGDRRSGEARV